MSKPWTGTCRLMVREYGLWRSSCCLEINHAGPCRDMDGNTARVKPKRRKAKKAGRG